MNSGRAFLSGIVDYAGLFPPATLDMDSAVKAYATYRAGADRDLLGRFVVTADRLGELASAGQDLFGLEENPWRVSAIAGDDLRESRAAVEEFNIRNAGARNGGAICDAVELRVTSASQVAAAVGFFGDAFKVFLEVPLHSNPAELALAISRTTAAAKMRTGGVVESAIPSTTQILSFMMACTEAGIPFKATAGLHHAVRGMFPLTYEDDAPRAMMHGYLNVFFGAAFCASGRSVTALQVLEEEDPPAFRFDEKGGWWRNTLIGTADLERVRENVALSFGSCSFVEPVAEARQLQLI